MSKFTAILEAQADGTLHLPLPAELRQGKVQVTATLAPANGSLSSPRKATPEMLRLRQSALQKLCEAGGLQSAIPDPVAWQREQRQDRPLPGRD